MDEELKNEINEELNDTADTVENEVAAEEEQPQAEIETEAEEESVGNIKISVDVVSTIAGIATTELEGVAGMYSSFAGGIVEKLGAKKNPSKGVKVEMTESTVAIDLYIVVEYGVRIPELAWEIQENVKNNVETMTGLSVEKVNIHIEGVSFAKETAELASVETELLPEAE
jgi:uncharacterized alkaline shock family protein YloU